MTSALYSKSWNGQKKTTATSAVVRAYSMEDAMEKTKRRFWLNFVVS